MFEGTVFYLRILTLNAFVLIQVTITIRRSQENFPRTRKKSNWKGYHWKLLGLLLFLMPCCVHAPYWFSVEDVKRKRKEKTR